MIECEGGEICNSNIGLFNQWKFPFKMDKVQRGKAKKNNKVGHLARMAMS